LQENKVTRLKHAASDNTFFFIGLDLRGGEDIEIN